MTPLENLLRNNTVLYFLSLPFPFTSPCARSSPCLARAQWLALEIILSLQMTKQVPTGGPWGKITQLRTSWSSRGPRCLLESHWWHWRCEGNSVKRSSSPPADKSWGIETQHYPSVMPLMTFLNDIYHPMVTVPLNDGVLRELGFGGLQRDCVSSTSKWLFSDQDYKEKVKHNSFRFLYRSVNGAFQTHQIIRRWSLSYTKLAGTRPSPVPWKSLLKKWILSISVSLLVPFLRALWTSILGRRQQLPLWPRTSLSSHSVMQGRILRARLDLLPDGNWEEHIHSEAPLKAQSRSTPGCNPFLLKCSKEFNLHSCWDNGKFKVQFLRAQPYVKCPNNMGVYFNIISP